MAVLTQSHEATYNENAAVPSPSDIPLICQTGLGYWGPETVDLVRASKTVKLLGSKSFVRFSKYPNAAASPSYYATQMLPTLCWDRLSNFKLINPDKVRPAADPPAHFALRARAATIYQLSSTRPLGRRNERETTDQRLLLPS